MKKLITWALLLATLLTLFAGCKQNTDNKPDVNYDLEAAMEYIKTVYKEAPEKTSRDFQRIAVVPVGNKKFEVKWSVDVPETVVKFGETKDGLITVHVNQDLAEDTPYVLTATITDGKTTLTKSWNHVAPKSMKGDIAGVINDAFALEPGASLDYEATLTGVITVINTPYDAGYKNITVTIAIEGFEGKNIQCYRLKGEGAENLAVTDTITVTGTLTNYNGNVQFGAGCTLDKVVKGEGAPEAPTDSKVIVDEAFALAPGGALPYASVTLTGPIVKIGTPYDASYGNITVTIEVEGTSGKKEIVCYRMKGEGADTLKPGDIITVTGAIINYADGSEKGLVEFNAGCTLDKVVDGGVELPTAPSNPKEIVDAALKLKDGEALMYKEPVTLTGKLATINTEYSEQYKNITVTMIVESSTGTAQFQAYRLTGDGIADLKVGNIITVKGNLVNYKGNVQFAAGCELVKAEKGDASDEQPEDTKPSVTLTPVDAPVAGTAYKFYLTQKNLQDKVLYLTGEMNGYYYATTDDATKAVDVYVESVSGGVRVYFLKGDVKNYLEIVKSGTHNNVVFTTEPTKVLKYNTAIKGVTCDVEGTEMYFGTYGTYKTFSASDISYVTGENAGKLDVAQGNFVAHFGTVTIVEGEGGSGEGGDDTPDTPVVPDPTPDTELSIKDALALGASKEHNVYTEGKYYVTGVITEVYQTTYGNMKITDAEGNILTVYGTYDATGATKYGDLSWKPVAGYTVTVYGIIGQYNGTVQLKNGWITEMTPVADAELTVDNVLTMGATMADGDVTADKYYVTGKVSAVTGGAFGKITLKGKSGKTIEVSGTMSLKPVVGDTLTVYGTVSKSGEAVVMKGAWSTALEKLPAMPTDSKVIVDNAFELAAGEVLEYAEGNKVVLTGVIKSIDTPYSSQYKNITVTVYVEGSNGLKELVVYRLKGEGADALAEGDMITVQGTIKNYNGTIEFDSGCQLQAVKTAAQVMEDAFALETGAALTGKYILSGELVKIDTPYDSGYKNITVTLRVGDKNIQCFRLKGEGADTLAVGDMVTVYGQIKNYNGKVQFNSGCTIVDVEKPKVGIVVGTAYKFGMVQENVSTEDVYYLTGSLSGNYMATSTDASAAVEVYVEETEGGYYLYAMVGGAKKYVNMVVSGTYVNGKYEDAAATVYTYDSDSNTLVATVSDALYWFGTRNDKTYTTVGPVKVEFAGFYCQLYPVAG